ncbi:MAG: hypothetical protein M3Z64_03425 [Verrucomicrobiota bacterium]|nr:hypothetical protein [Verrucomicrobiota bacterium]
MTAIERKKCWRRSPFVPFDIIVPGREKLHVPHPDFLSVSPSGRIAKVWLNDDDEAAVDVLPITALEENSNGGKKHRKTLRR